MCVCVLTFKVYFIIFHLSQFKKLFFWAVYGLSAGFAFNVFDFLGAFCFDLFLQTVCAHILL